MQAGTGFIYRLYVSSMHTNCMYNPEIFLRKRNSNVEVGWDRTGWDGVRVGPESSLKECEGSTGEAREDGEIWRNRK